MRRLRLLISISAIAIALSASSVVAKIVAFWYT